MLGEKSCWWEQFVLAEYSDSAGKATIATSGRITVVNKASCATFQALAAGLPQCSELEGLACLVLIEICQVYAT